MKRALLAFSLLAMVMLFSNSAIAQCTPDTTLTGTGFAPNPLPCGTVGVPYDEVVSFRFPADTAYELGGGLPPLTVPFDSFALDTITNIPAGLGYVCNMPGCVYVTSPPNPTFGCVTISGTPTMAHDITDSAVVTGIAYITVFGSAVDLSIDLNIAVEVINPGDTCSPTVSRNVDLESKLDMEIYPNPITSTSRVGFNMWKAGDVSIDVYDMMGQKVAEVHNGRLGAGKQTFDVNMDDLPGGIYFVRFDMNNGEFSTMEKVLSVK